MRTIRTAENRERFLEAVRETGNVRDACRALHLHRPTMYAWRDDDPSFRDAWEEALAMGGEALEDEARRRAMNGSDILPIFLLKGLKPEKYRDRSTVDVNQTILRHVPMPELRKRLAQLRQEQAAYELAMDAPVA
jgi:hypothetical protein